MLELIQYAIAITIAALIVGGIAFAAYDTISHRMWRRRVGGDRRPSHLRDHERL